MVQKPFGQCFGLHRQGLHQDAKTERPTNVRSWVLRWWMSFDAGIVDFDERGIELLGELMRLD